MNIVPLCLDKMREYLAVLNELSNVDLNISDNSVLQKAYDYITTQNKSVIIALNDDDKVIGTASIIFEKKLIHGFSLVGHIEDVVVKSGNRNSGVGKLMVEKLVNMARESGCYKVLLSCSEANVGFYAKHNFKPKEVTMRKNL